jgi:hypothetical protein
MTEKRYYLGYEDDFFRWINDSIEKKNYIIKIGFEESDDLQDVVDLLNSQDKHIFLLKSVIQTITAESYDKDSISKERIGEIKDYWYEKIRRVLE